MTIQIPSHYQPTFGNFRSAFHAQDWDRAWVVARGLENPDERRIALRQLLVVEAEEKGETEATVTYQIENTNVWRKGERRFHHPKDIDETVEVLTALNEEFHRGIHVHTITKPRVGLDATYVCGSDSYGRVVTAIKRVKGEIKEVTVMDKGEHTRRIEAGEAWEGQGVVFTRREKRTTGKRGWVRKGHGIDAMRYSGIFFGRADDRYDPHF